MTRVRSVSTVWMLAALAASVTLWLAHEARGDRERTASIRQQRRALESALRDAQTRKSTPHRPVTSATASSGREAKHGTPDLTNANEEAIVSSNPALQTQQREVDRAFVPSLYVSLFRRLELTPAQMDAFAEIKATRRERMRDTIAALAQQGISQTNSAAQSLFQQIDHEEQNAMRDLLGLDRLAEWQRYERSAPLREYATSFAGAAAMRSAAMTPAQIDQLVDAMAASIPPQPGDTLSAEAINWSTLLAQAGSFLSPMQLDVLANVEPTGAQYVGGRHLLEFRAALQKALEADEKAGGASGG